MALSDIEIHKFQSHLINHINEGPVRSFRRDHRTDERECIICIHIVRI